MRRSVAAVMTGGALLGLAATATAAVLLTPEPVKTGDADEQNPAATAAWFAWTQRPAAHPNRPNVYAEAMPVGGGDRFRVNPSGTRAWTGGIDGDTLVYQRIKEGQSDIRLFNLATEQQAGTDADLNTRNWEWHPTISTATSGEQWVELGRQNLRTGVQKVLVHNVTTHETRTLGQVDRISHSAIPGQVSGDWATWTLCKPRCNVRFLDLSDPAATTTTIPRPAGVTHQYASSITPGGTVYFVESGSGCGASVKIDSYAGTTRTQLVSLSAGRDILSTYTSAEGADNHVYYDRVVCSKGRWNIYKVVDTP